MIAQRPVERDGAVDLGTRCRIERDKGMNVKIYGLPD